MSYIILCFVSTSNRLARGGAFLRVSCDPIMISLCRPRVNATLMRRMSRSKLPTCVSMVKTNLYPTPTHIGGTVAAYEGQYDACLVTTLILVHGKHFNSRALCVFVSW